MLCSALFAQLLSVFSVMEAVATMIRSYLSRTFSVYNKSCSFVLFLRSAKKTWEDDKSKPHTEKDKAHCLWDSITMTMKQITPTRKIDKMEGWEPPQLNDGKEEEKHEPEKKKSDSSPLSSPLSLSLPHSLGLPSWVGLGSEEDSSRYASLTESQNGGPAQWAARARDKLAAVRRKSPASLSESTWEGLK